MTTPQGWLLVCHI